MGEASATRILKLHEKSELDAPLRTLSLAYAIIVKTFSENESVSINVLLEENKASTQLNLTLNSVCIVGDLLDEVEKQLRDGSTSNEVVVTGDDKPNIWRSSCVVPLHLCHENFVNKAQNGPFPLVLTCGQKAEGDYPILKAFHSSNNPPKPGDVDALMDLVEHLIPQIEASKKFSLTSLDLLTLRDKQRFQQWYSDMPAPLQNCMHSMVEEQARLHPDREAVCAYDGSFTYTELNQRSSILAQTLLRKGVTLGSCVPIMFEKSKWHVVALLAVMKAGAAFSALEWTMPDGRIKLICDQLEQVDVVLSSPSQSQRMEKLGKPVVVVDESTTSAELQSTTFDAPLLKGVAVGPTTLAYVIFTSGSTGVPKGAMIEHEQFCTSMAALNDKIHATADMRVFQMTAFNFDLSIAELFCPLLCGGCVCLPSEWARFNDVYGAISRLRVNFGSFSPSFLGMLDPDAVPEMQSVLLAGERVPAGLSSLWVSKGRRMVHMYGPTECTVGCTFLDSDIHEHYDGFLGDMYASKVWVVDSRDHECLVPVGAPGELVVEGPIVGRGYIDPNLHKSSFVDRPRWFSKIVGRKANRFYKTGDLGYLREDGRVSILGRKDTQTKIRGLRVEIQEIEYQIQKAWPEKRSVAVEVRNPTRIPGQEMLIAFVAYENLAESDKQNGCVDDSKISVLNVVASDAKFVKIAKEVQEKIRDVLPNYMVPSNFLPVKSLPFTNSYKLDRRALRALAESTDLKSLQFSKKGQLDNLSSREQSLAKAWSFAMHLPMDEVSVHQDFFDIGGDSLKAIAFVNAARRNGVSLSVSQLYEKRTLARLASLGPERLDTQQDIPLPFSLCPANEIPKLISAAVNQLQVTVEDVEDIMPVLDTQAWYLKYQKEYPRSYQIPFAFRLPDDVDIKKLKEAWEAMLKLHPMLRTRFIHREKYWQVVLKQAEVFWRPEKSLANFMRALRGVQLQCGSYQSGLVASGQGLFLIWYSHHALSDHMMTELMIDDVWTLYRGEKVPRRNAFSGLVQHRLQQTPQWPDLHKVQYFPLVTHPPGAKILGSSRMSFDVTLGEDWLGGRGYAMILAAWAVAFRELNGARDHGFLVMKNGRGPRYPGSETIIGPLFERVPVNVSLHNDSVDLEAIAKAIKGPGIVDERTLNQSIIDNAININFGVNSTGELIDRGMHTHPLIFRIIAEVRGVNAVIFVMFDESWLKRSLMERIVRLFVGGLEKLRAGLPLDGCQCSVEIVYEQKIL